MTASRIILVRHAKPVLDASLPPRAWSLPPASHVQVERLVPPLLALGVDAVIASPEIKARQTGQVIADALHMRLAIDADIREQGGEHVPWIAREEAFRQAVVEHFARPEEAVLGEETSREAAERFSQAVARARLAYGCPVLVTHGRILSGYMGREFDVDPIKIWPDLRMPDAFEIDLDARTWTRIEEEQL